MMTTKRLWRHAAVGLILAGPAGGFLFGVFNAGDSDPNPIGRFFHACLMAGLTPLHGGFPPHGVASAGQTINVWPHITISGLLIFGGLAFRDWKNDRRKKNQ